MTGPHPAVAATRRVVRDAVADLPEGSLILVACSGGSDSLALAAAAAFVCPRAGVRAGAVLIDHQLQDDSAAVAARAAAACRALGLDPVEVVRVEVDGGGGPEAAAREARYAALERVRAAHGARAVLLGHTADDQAEQVLLGLVRGSGTRSLAGIPPRGAMPRTGEAGALLRPFVDEITREQTRAACTAQDLTWWDDPHNADPRFLRVRARAALGRLEETLGPGVRANLVRTAQIARADADLLDDLARQQVAGLGPGPWPVDALAAIPDAVRARVWRALMLRSGATGSDVGRVHVRMLDGLVTGWHGQGPIDIPGRLRVRRAGSFLHVERRRVE